MIRGKARRAHADFIRALEVQTENHGFATIEFLQSEIAELNKVFQKNNLGIAIKGHWIMQNISYGVEMSTTLADREARLLNILLTPLKLTELHMVLQHGIHSSEEKPRSYNTYKRLDEVDNRNKLFDTIRSAIEKASPEHLRDIVSDLIHNPEEADFPENYITDKYFVDTEIIRQNPKAAKAQAYAAYVDALNYQ